MDVLGRRRFQCAPFIALSLHIPRHYAYIRRRAPLLLKPSFQSYSRRASYKPTAEEAAKAKALINFLMQDRLFFALYRSNDAQVRAAAIDKLNKAHYQAYGDASTQDDDAGGVASSAPSCTLITPVPREEVMKA